MSEIHMNMATVANYNKHFGADAFVPGYCGKCPGADKIGDDPVCGVYAEGAAPLIIEPMATPPKWCPIRHISSRPGNN